MEEKPKDEPAFPRDHRHDGHNGLSTREYAAIKLRVPNSGTEWLDGMIRQSLRDELAAKAMQAAATNPVGADGFTFDQRAEWAYAQARAMIKARGET